MSSRPNEVSGDLSPCVALIRDKIRLEMTLCKPRYLLIIASLLTFCVFVALKVVIKNKELWIQK